MRYIYTAGFYLALPFILLRSLWRTKHSPRFLRKLFERIGFYSFEKYPVSIWVHTVSYGEAIAAEPLIKRLRQVFPKTQVVITTMTLTGAMRIQSTWAGDNGIRHIYLPYDIPFAIKRFFAQTSPAIGIIMETELWPNLLYYAGQNKIPMILANARLSPNSLKGYLRIKKFILPFMKNLTQIAAQSEPDAKRFLALGVPLQQIKVLGNLKFDIVPPSQQITDGLAVKQKLSFSPILVAASTHSNEEEQLIDLFTRIKANFPSALLILVPRHPERFDEVARLCIDKGHHLTRRSDQAFPSENTSIFLGDTMGELYYFYSLADVAFVGGSLVPVGGHNLLEPAALKLAIVTGSYLHNFETIKTLLSESGTLHIAHNTEELYLIFSKLFNDLEYCQKIGLQGYAVIEKNQGAVERYLDAVRDMIKNPQ